MAYFSANDSDTLSGFGCGPECSCGPCRSNSGLNEWYEREERDEPEAPKATAAPPKQPPAASPAPGQVNGMHSNDLGGYGRCDCGSFPDPFSPLRLIMRRLLSPRCPRSPVRAFVLQKTCRCGRRWL
jgi:hypothetical protein